MDKKEREQRFDGILFSLAEQHPQGVIDVIFSFFIFAIVKFIIIYSCFKQSPDF
jgi:hypothetical protein